MKVKNYLFILFFCLNFSLLFGQEKTDYSKLPFQKIEDSINRYFYSDTAKAINLSNAYIFKAKQIKDKEKECEGYLALCTIYERHREIDKAQNQLDKALKIATKNNFKEELINSYFLRAQIQLNRANGTKAMDAIEKALSLAEEINHESWRENILHFYSYVHHMSGDGQKAIEIRKRIIKFYRDKPFDSTFSEEIKAKYLVQNYSFLSSSFLKLKETDSARYYTGLIADLVNPEDSCQQRILYESEAEIDFIEGNYSKAKKKFKKAFKLCDPNSRLIDLNMKYDLGKSAHGEGNFEEAQKLLQTGIDNFGVKPAEEGFMSDYYKILADSYKETSELEKANIYFEKYISTLNEVDKIKSQVKASTKAKEIEKFRSDVKLLEAEKEEKQTYLNYLFLGASIIILLLLVVLLRFYRNKKKNEDKFEALMLKIESTNETYRITDTKDQVLEDKSSNDVPEETKQQILAGLKKLEEKEYFLSQNCNSYNMAKKINTNTSYLSKVINSHFGKNFNTYINDLRINYAIVRLKNDVIFRSYSIQSIAEELGYRSADSFSKYFKLNTGLNPSFYIKEIKNIA